MWKSAPRARNSSGALAFEVKLFSMTPAPPSRPGTSSRVQHAERNVRLDPQGIYGTRSARRQNQLRRRRQFQNAVLWLLGAVLMVILGRWALQPRQGARAASETLSLPFRPAAATVFAANGDLLFTSQSGGLWRAKISEIAGRSSPLAAPRRVFSHAFAPAAPPLVSPTQIFWPGGDGTLVALDGASDGVSAKVQWRAALPSALVARPALVEVENRSLIVAGDDGGEIAAFDAKNGALRWKKSAGGAVGGGIGVLEAQNGAGAGVVVPLAAGPNSRGGLLCLDAKSGALRWSFPGDARSQSGGIAVPTAWKNRVFWCNDEGAVVCLDGKTGRKIWKSFAAPQTQSGDKLVTLRGSPLVVEALDLVVVGGNDGILRAFDVATGKPRWTSPLGGALRFPAQSLVFEGRAALLAAGEMPAIFLLDAETGSVLRRWSTRYPNSNGVVFTSKNAYALDAEGHLQIAPLQ